MPANSADPCRPRVGTALTGVTGIVISCRPASHTHPRPARAAINTHYANTLPCSRRRAAGPDSCDRLSGRSRARHTHRVDCTPRSLALRRPNIHFKTRIRRCLARRRGVERLQRWVSPAITSECPEGAGCVRATCPGSMVAAKPRCGRHSDNTTLTAMQMS